MMKPSFLQVVLFVAIPGSSAAQVTEKYTRFGRFITERVEYDGDKSNPGSGCYGLEIPYKEQLETLTNIQWTCICHSETTSVVCATDPNGRACCDGQCGYFSTSVALDVDNIDNINFLKARNECYKPSKIAKFFCVDYAWEIDSRNTYYDECNAYIESVGKCNSCQMNQCLVIGNEARPSFDCSNAPALPVSGQCPAFQYATNQCTFVPDDEKLVVAEASDVEVDSLQQESTSGAKNVNLLVSTLLVGVLVSISTFS